MKTITVYGASDDLIEIEGDIRDEFSPTDDEVGYVACSDGTVLSIEYAKDGCWRVNRVVKGTAAYKKIEAEGSDTDNYSDRVTLTGDIAWIVLGTQFRKVKP